MKNIKNDNVCVIDMTKASDESVMKMLETIQDDDAILIEPDNNYYFFDDYDDYNGSIGWDIYNELRDNESKLI